MLGRRERITWHPPRVSWSKIPIVALIITGAVVAILMAISSGSSTPFTGVQGQVDTAPAVSRAPVPEPRIAQVVSTGPKIFDTTVVWNPTKGFDPFTIPVEEGFYNGTDQNVPYGAQSTKEGMAYALRIAPELDKEGEEDILVSPSRDAVNKDIVFVGISALHSGPDGFSGLSGLRDTRLLRLSVDGEKSWCNLNLLPVPGGAVSTRVRVADGSIHLYAEDTRTGHAWWDTAVRLSDLPCFSQ